MSQQANRTPSTRIEPLPEPQESLTQEQASQVVGGRFKRNGVIPGYQAPTVISDDGINIQTTDPGTSNVGYDSPFTPIPQ